MQNYDDPRFNDLEKNKMGQFQIVDKTLLTVDPGYQRFVKPDDAKVRRIQREFCWPAFGVLTIAKRANGFFVADGQHRYLAAMSLPAVKSLPCMVFESSSQREDAKLFLQTNVDRKPMTAIHKFNAQVAVGDHAATVAKELLDFAGKRVGNGNGTGEFRPIGALVRCVQVDEAAMRRVWPVVLEIFGHEPINQFVLRGAHYCERFLVTGSLTDRKIRKKLADAGPDEIWRQIRSARGMMGIDGEKPMGVGVLSVINHRTRNKLELKL